MAIAVRIIIVACNQAISIGSWSCCQITGVGCVGR